MVSTTNVGQRIKTVKIPVHPCSQRVRDPQLSRRVRIVGGLTHWWCWRFYSFVVLTNQTLYHHWH